MRMSDYGFGAVEMPPPPPSESTLSTYGQQIVDFIGKAFPLYQQKAVFDAQLKLLKQQAASSGSLIDPSKITVPGIPVNVGVDSHTKMMIGLGIGAVALILLMKKR